MRLLHSIIPLKAGQENRTASVGANRKHPPPKTPQNQKTTHNTPDLADCPQHPESLQPPSLLGQLPQDDPGREDYEDTIVCTHSMDYREERPFLNMLHTPTYSVRKQQAAELGECPTCLFPAPQVPRARDLPPSRNPILPRFVLALKTHLRTHRLLTQVKSSSRSAHCQELLAASARQEGSKVQETPGARLTDSAPIPNRAPFVPDLPGSAIRRGKLMHNFPAV